MWCFLIIKNRLNYIDALETFAMILVVFCHIFGGVGTSFISNTAMQFATTIAVPLFLMANGTLLFIGKFDLKKHLKKIFWLFVASVIWKIIYLFAILANTGFDISTLSFIGLFNYFCGANLTSPYVPTEHFWFIYKLIGIYILFPVLKLCYDSKNKAVLKWLAAFLFVFVFLYTDYNQFAGVMSIRFARSNFSMETLRSFISPLNMNENFLLYFIIGIIGPFVHNYVFEKNISKKSKALLIFATVISFCVLLVEKKIQVGTLSGKWVRLSGDYQRTGTLIMAVCIFAFFASMKFRFEKLNRFFEFVSKRTMNIYVAHMLLCAFWYWYVYPLYQRSNLLTGIGCTLVMMVLSIIITEPFTYIPGLRRVAGLSPSNSFKRNKALKEEKRKS